MAVTIVRVQKASGCMVDPCADPFNGIPTKEQAKAKREACACAAAAAANLPPPSADYSILDALKEFHEHKRKGTLMLVNNASGLGYKVKHHTPKGETELIGPDHKKVHAVITEREAKLYHVLWRV